MLGLAMTLNFQDLILNLSRFWSDYGCIIQQPYDTEKGASTMNPATFLRALGPEPWSTAMVEPCRRPTDARYGENPNRLGHYFQYQVILKPSPDNAQELYLKSLEAMGIDLKEHDVRFVEDNWESPTLGAAGVGWEVWLDGMEITQFTYFQQVGGLEIKPVALEITYGLERIAMYLQNVDSVYDVMWNKELKYGQIYLQNEIEQSKYELSDDERSEVAALIGDENYVTFDDKLVIILVESLEDWAVNPVSMPHLYDFIKKHPRIWAHRISKQTLNGASSDGQLIINTGLLPISQGATCYLFPSNKYPSIAACCPNPSATIIPHEPTVWNQHYMSRSFGYDTTVVMTPNDSLLAQKTIDMLHEGYQMVQVITMASHIPFTYGASRSNLKLPESMPRFMADYMKSLHYTDEGLSLLFDAIDNDSTLFNTTIVITGDHTIFYSDQRYEYDLYCQQAGFNYAVTEAYCPLIIHSAKRILHDIDINQVAFQMDIYPTIMSLIGCKNYYWSGLGIDLSDTTKGLNRIVTEQQAYYMSNLLIRSNYFSN